VSSSSPSRPAWGWPRRDSPPVWAVPKRAALHISRSPAPCEPSAPAAWTWPSISHRIVHWAKHWAELGRHTCPASVRGRLGKGLADSPNGPVLFIGTDAPDISATLLRQAVRALQRNDAVFGPADDGGFWLFGVNKRPGLPSLFDNVRWSGPHARADVQANLPSSFRLTLLETLQDLDEEPDWRRWNANKLR